MKGILLVNLGTPNSPHIWDVYRYLIEFLTDQKVIDLPWFKRHFLVRGVIVPARLRQSANSYRKIWTKEGSPLMVHSRNVQRLLQAKLGSGLIVELAMRYQNPSLEKGILRLLSKGAKELVILPLFPQFADATTGSIIKKVTEITTQIAPRIPLHFVPPFADHPAFIQAIANIQEAQQWRRFDHVLFSYHGLPERQLKNRNFQCLTKGCCSRNGHCYRAQCLATTKAVTTQLGIPTEKYSICFQSRLGKEPWLQPYASDVIAQLGKGGCKKLLVFSPSFVCDCLETVFEIKEEYGAEFRHAGGGSLELVPGLNDSSLWIDALAEILFDFNESIK